MNELQIASSNIMDVWAEENLREIHELFAPNLSPIEFKAFVGMGKATGLNPFLREIWAIKYDKSKPPQIFIGRDGYRKSGQQHPEYDYHRVEAVYSEDFFENNNGVINHKYGFAKRGILLGAYCMIKRKNSSKETFVSVMLHEYDKKQSNWNSMKETMIKKVAESQGFRFTFQEKFSGTYSEYEDYIDGQVVNVQNSDEENKSQTQKLLDRIKNEKGTSNESITIKNNDAIMAAENSTTECQDILSSQDNAPKEPVSGGVVASGQQEGIPHQSKNASLQINQEQLDEIDGLLHERKFDVGRIEKALKHFKVKSFAQMTKEQGVELIGILNKTE